MLIYFLNSFKTNITENELDYWITIDLLHLPYKLRKSVQEIAKGISLSIDSHEDDRGDSPEKETNPLSKSTQTNSNVYNELVWIVRRSEQF